MIKSLSVAILGALTIGAVAPEIASARTQCEDLGDGYTYCYVDNGHSGADYLRVANRSNGDETTLRVICTGGGGNRWTSYGNLTRSDNQFIANHWCKRY